MWNRVCVCACMVLTSCSLVKTATRNFAILDKMWSNMSPVYGFPSVIGELGTSDHKMVLLVPVSNTRYRNDPENCYQAHG